MGRKIWIDDRESEETQNYLIERMQEHGHEPEVKRRPAGDIVAPGVQAGIERKTVNDFLNSVSDKRIWKQMDKMNDHFETKGLIVVGSHIEDWVAEIYGGHAHATRMLLGTLAYVSHQPDWSGFWIQSDDPRENSTLLAEYALAWFRQADKAKQD